jgi:N-acetylmuramoyl-L-alanine amidase
MAIRSFWLVLFVCLTSQARLILPAHAQDAAPSAPAPPAPPASTLVAIDVGHSKTHLGATSARGKPEFEFNAALAGVISHTLQQQNIKNSLIGHDGSMVDLLPRSRAAQQMGASFFLSVHHDSARPEYLKKWRWRGKKYYVTDRFSGFSLFVSRKNPQLERSLLCARAIGYAMKIAGLRPTPHHSANIAGENREWADQDAGVYFFDDLVVLKNASMPALLLEAGVIVNRRDERTLQTPKRQQLVAQAVALGLRNCGVDAVQ